MHSSCGVRGVQQGCESSNWADQTGFGATEFRGGDSRPGHALRFTRGQAVDFQWLTRGHKMLCWRIADGLDLQEDSGVIDDLEKNNVTS